MRCSIRGAGASGDVNLPGGICEIGACARLDPRTLLPCSSYASRPAAASYHVVSPMTASTVLSAASSHLRLPKLQCLRLGLRRLGSAFAWRRALIVFLHHCASLCVTINQATREAPRHERIFVQEFPPSTLHVSVTRRARVQPRALITPSPRPLRAPRFRGRRPAPGQTRPHRQCRRIGSETGGGGGGG